MRRNDGSDVAGSGSRPGASLLLWSIAVCATLLVTPPSHARGVTQLMPDSALFDNGAPFPVRAQFLPDQPFDLVAVVQPGPGRTIEHFEFYVDGRPTLAAAEPRRAVRGDCATIAGREHVAPCTIMPENAHAPTVLMHAQYAHREPGVHVFKVVAWQDDGARISASGNFEIVDRAFVPALAGSTIPRN